MGNAGEKNVAFLPEAGAAPPKPTNLSEVSGQFQGLAIRRTGVSTESSGVRSREMSPRGLSELSVALHRLDPEPVRGGLCSIRLNAPSPLCLMVLTELQPRADRLLSAFSQPAVKHLQASLVATDHTVQSEIPTHSLMPIAPHSVALCPLGPHSSAWPHGLSKVFSLIKLLPFSKHGCSSPPDTLCPSPRVLSLCPARPHAMGSTSVKPSFPSMPSSSCLSRVRD